MRDARPLNSAWAWAIWFVQLALALTAFVIAIDALTNGPKQHEDRAGYCEPKQDGAILEPIGVDGADKNAAGEQRVALQPIDKFAERAPFAGERPRQLRQSENDADRQSGDGNSEFHAFPPMGFETRTLAVSKDAHNPMSGVRA